MKSDACSGAQSRRLHFEGAARAAHIAGVGSHKSEVNVLWNWRRKDESHRVKWGALRP